MKLFLEDIGNLCELINGRAFKPSEWVDSGLPIIRIQNLNDETKPFNYFNGDVSQQHLVQNGDLLFSWSGTPGTSFGAFFWNRGKAVLNQHIFNVKYDKDKIYGNYFKIALNSKLSAIIGQSHGGVGLKHITKGKLEAIPIPLPPLNDQIRIATVLSRAEKLIAKRKESINALDDFLKSTFLEMFGDPVRNEKGWEKKSLSSFINKNRDVSYGIVQRGEHVENGIPVVRIRDIIESTFIEENLVRTTIENSRKYARTVLQGGELLISIRGTIGELSIAPSHSKGWNISREVAIIPVEGEINLLFLLCLLKSKPIQTVFRSLVKGVAQSGMNLSDIRLVEIIYPPIPIQNKFAAIVNKVESLKSKYSQNLTELENLYGSLSQRAFKGELDLNRVIVEN